MESRFVSFGDKAIDFTYNTPYGKTMTLSEKVKQADKTYLIFLRYYGCTICQLDIKAYRENYQKFLDKNAQILLVLQSEPSTIAEGITEAELKFDVACDPNQELYKAYQIGAAKNKLGLASIKTIRKMQAAKKSGLVHGAYEGNEMQLPALFLLDSNMNVVYAHRAKSAGDMPEISDMLAKL
ncbi:MAG: redoxin domain-containing protein [Clostridiales bacterium]|nr:redoxin domain-containing protein [Clostridiales bacterium]